LRGRGWRGLVANWIRSIGLALTDTLDDLISEERIHPQLAMKILGNFDQAITEALQKNVKSRLQFKVGCGADHGYYPRDAVILFV
jgi:hypothetical protein